LHPQKSKQYSKNIKVTSLEQEIVPAVYADSGEMESKLSGWKAVKSEAQILNDIISNMSL
jgi:hypothetical protein